MDLTAQEMNLLAGSAFFLLRFSLQSWLCFYTFIKLDCSRIPSSSVTGSAGWLSVRTAPGSKCLCSILYFLSGFLCTFQLFPWNRWISLRHEVFSDIMSLAAGLSFWSIYLLSCTPLKKLKNVFTA